MQILFHNFYNKTLSQISQRKMFSRHVSPFPLSITLLRSWRKIDGMQYASNFHLESSISILFLTVEILRVY